MTANKQGNKTTQKQTRRRAHGSAWHWQQTDGWYFTPPGTKRREALLDSSGRRIKGKSNKQAAELALARLRAKSDWKPAPEKQIEQSEVLLVGKICSEYIEHCAERFLGNHVCAEHRDQARRILNDLASYCGALPVIEVQKAHLEHWLELHPTWRSPVTRRNNITTVLAAFEFARESYGIRNPLQGFSKPGPRPRLHSLSPADEQAMYGATDKPFRNFLFAALHTGLRPFCELAGLRVRNVEVQRGAMLWRVYSSKTRKTRKIPISSAVSKLLASRLKTGDQEAILFPNAQGNVWKKVTGVARFLKIKRSLGWDSDPLRNTYSCYSCRHTFAHRLLSGYWNNGAGCTIETLAEMMGNTPQVAFAHYGREWGRNYQDPLWAAIGGSSSTLD